MIASHWRNIRLIFRREMRDQLRDRRTLFMIAVLPVLFYPLLGISFFQIAQFLREHPSKVLVIGHESTDSSLPSLIDNEQLSRHVSTPDDSRLIELEFLPLDNLKFVRDGRWPANGKLTAKARSELYQELDQIRRAQKCDAVLCFPPHFFKQLAEYPDRLRAHTHQPVGQPPRMPSPEVLFDNSNDKTALARGRVDRALTQWSKQVGRKSLEQSHLSTVMAAPITFNKSTVAADEERLNTSLWSKVLPFVLMIWAVTGAFYPAVDLCAGEKERGTLETLLCSPARRGEIVLGKLLTVTLFSITTAVLNLISMGITGAVVMNHLGSMPSAAGVGPPPFLSMVWLSIILIPVSAMFSAICLALAAFARSTKEGQYYLMPVILVTMPLVLLPMHPGAELNLGFSLIPVSGVVLLMRSTMEGTFSQLWPYAFPVAGVTFACCWLSVRWAVDQFRSEEVLFREGEQWDISSWLKHTLRDRQPTPTVALAVLCGVLILIVKFFLQSILGGGASVADLHRMEFSDFFRQQTIFQLGTVLAPTLLMTFFLTRSPRKTLQLNRVPFLTLPAAAVLAISLMPMVVILQVGIGSVYEMPPEVKSIAEALSAKFNTAPVGWALVMIALIPAVCEELAFRGFILSGFRHSGHKWRAIAFSSLFFGVTHAFVNQQINGFFLGLVLGYLVIQTGSLWPAMIYHVVHNSTFYLAGRYGIAETIGDSDLLFGLSIFFGTMIAVALLFWFHQMRYDRTQEESLQEAIDRGSSEALPSPLGANG